MKKLFLIVIGLSLISRISSQIPVTDAAANANLVTTVTTLGKQFTTLVEQKNRLDESLDFMRKINRNVSDAKMVYNILDRQRNLSDKCIELVKTQDLSANTALTLTTTVEAITNNNIRMIDLSQRLLSTGLKMNDSERLMLLKEIEKDLREDEKRIYKLSSLIREYRTLKNLLKN